MSTPHLQLVENEAPLRPVRAASMLFEAHLELLVALSYLSGAENARARELVQRADRFVEIVRRAQWAP